MKILAICCLVNVIFISLSKAELIEEPKGCRTEKHKQCALKTLKVPFAISWGKVKINLAKDSAIQINSDRLIVLSGSVWVESDSPQIIESPFVSIELKGKIWLDANLEKTVVKNIGTSQISLKTNSNSEEVLPVGFENWYSRLDENKEAFKGVISPLDFKMTLAKSVEMFRIPKEQSRTIAEDWRHQWKDNVQASSQFYSDVAEKKLRQQSDSEKLIESKRQQSAKEKSALKDLYRRRNGLTDQGL